MRILVCGDRNWTNKDLINKTLCSYWLQNHTNPLTIIHGGASGADSIAGEIAREQSQNELKFPADWERYGRAAGPIRNQQMLDESQPDVVLAFHNDIENSKGTKDMVNRAMSAGIKTIIFTED